MQKEKYICDAGSLAIEFNDGSIMRINNCYGDGEFKTYVFDSTEEFQDYKNNHYQFATMREDCYQFVGLNYFGKAKVLNYDSFEPYQKRVGWINKQVLFTLSGKYEIYVNSGKVYFVKVGKENFNEFKYNLLNEVNNFKKSFTALKEIFDTSDIDVNKFICEDYPFDKSFEELHISEWCDSINRCLDAYAEREDN